MSDTVRWDVAFYNLRVGRPMLRVREEVAAILLDDPHILAGCEAIGYVLPRVDGYRLLRNRRNASNANVFAYVADEIRVSGIRWIRMDSWWRRVLHRGKHEPRTILRFRAGRVPVFVTHGPQIAPGNTDKARAELVDALVYRMAPWKRTRLWRRLTERLRQRELMRPRILLWDPNALGYQVAKRVDGRVLGSPIEGAVISGQVRPAGPERFPRFVHGVELKSDHGRMFKVGLLIPRRWTGR